MENHIFCSVSADIDSNFLVKVAQSTTEHNSFFVNITEQANVMCRFNGKKQLWTVSGDWLNVNKAYKFLYTIYSLVDGDSDGDDNNGNNDHARDNSSASQINITDTGDAFTTEHEPLSVFPDQSTQNDVSDTLSSDLDKDELQISLSGSQEVDQLRTPVNDEICSTIEQQANTYEQSELCIGVKNSEILVNGICGSNKPQSQSIENIEKCGTINNDMQFDESSADPLCAESSAHPEDAEPHFTLLSDINFPSNQTLKNESTELDSSNGERVNGDTNELLVTLGNDDKNQLTADIQKSSLVTAGYETVTKTRRPKLDSQSQHPCNLCHKSFSTPSNLYRHVKSRHEGRRFSCPQCEKTFSCRNGLDHHKKIAHEGLRCDGCFQIFARRELLESHDCTRDKLSHHVKCSRCDKLYSSTSNLFKHVHQMHDGVIRYNCTLCQKEYKHRRSLTLHKQSEHGVFACTRCDQTFDQQNLLIQHFSESQTCSVTVPLSSLSPSSTSGESSGTTARCEHCGKLFSTNSNLAKHIRTIHEHKQRTCRICATSCTDNAHLRQHMKSSHQSSFYSCQICSMRFSSRRQLAKHQLLCHDGLVTPNSYQCERCCKTFLYRSNLIRHRKHDHEGLTFSCNKCQSSFKSKQQLHFHDRLVHLGLRHRCDICQKSFSTSYKLKEHRMSRHLATKYFTCQVCTSSCSSRAALANHLMKHHQHSYNVAGEIGPHQRPTFRNRESSRRTAAGDLAAATAASGSGLSTLLMAVELLSTSIPVSLRPGVALGTVAFTHSALDPQTFNAGDQANDDTTVFNVQQEFSAS